MKILKCPNCGGEEMSIHHNIDPRRHGHYVSCNNCHWFGKTRLFKSLAIRTWNKESKRRETKKPANIGPKWVMM